jgi:radical SAM protein with 4Fe4S-binding SPASM domain
MIVSPRFIDGMGGNLLYFPESNTLWFSRPNEKIPDYSKPDYDPMRSLMGLQKSSFNTATDIKLSLFMDGLCNGSCGYCVTKNRSNTRTLDTERLLSFIRKHGNFCSINAFGGEPLRHRNLVGRLRSVHHKEIVITTGMAFDRSEFEELCDAAIKQNGTGSLMFSLSIDPPPEKGGEYARGFPGFKGDWHEEQVSRALWLAEKANIRVCAVISRQCWNWRALKNELGKYGDSITISQCHTSNDKFKLNEDTYAHLRQQYTDDITENFDRLSPHIFNSYINFIDPFINFMPGGCKEFHKKIVIGYDGSLGVCYDNKKATFGTLEEIDLNGYAAVLKRLHQDQRCSTTCSTCPLKIVCRTGCPLDPSIDVCQFMKIQAESILSGIAQMTGVHRINDLLPAKMKKMMELSKIPPMTDDDFLAYASLVFSK